MVEQRGFRSAGCRIVAARHYQRQFWQLARSGEMGRAASAGRCVAWMLAMLALAGTGRGDESLKRFSRTEIHMGVDFEVVLYAPDGATADRGLDAAMARIAELDSVLSDYKPESELSRLSAVSHVGAGKTAPAEFPAALVSPELWEVLAVSQEIAAASDGAFDITVGPLTKLWRRARRQKALPEPELFAAARAAVGWRYLKLDVRARTAQLMKANMRLDLGGIAKGYAADEALQKVSEAGLKRALVRASGDIAALEPPPSETGWLVGIAPLDPDAEPQRFVRLANMAISTSGDSRQHVVIDGRRYSHLIDPRSGLGIPGRSSVSVIAPRGILADSLASAVSILGPQDGLKLVEEFRGAVLLMVSEAADGELSTTQSPGFEAFEAAVPEELP